MIRSWLWFLTESYQRLYMAPGARHSTLKERSREVNMLSYQWTTPPPKKIPFYVFMYSLKWRSANCSLFTHVCTDLRMSGAPGTLSNILKCTIYIITMSITAFKIAVSNCWNMKYIVFLIDEYYILKTKCIQVRNHITVLIVTKTSNFVVAINYWKNVYVLIILNVKFCYFGCY